MFYGHLCKNKIFYANRQTNGKTKTVGAQLKANIGGRCRTVLKPKKLAL